MERCIAKALADMRALVSLTRRQHSYAYEAVTPQENTQEPEVEPPHPGEDEQGQMKVYPDQIRLAEEVSGRFLLFQEVTMNLFSLGSQAVQ